MSVIPVSLITNDWRHTTFFTAVPLGNYSLIVKNVSQILHPDEMAYFHTLKHERRQKSYLILKAGFLGIKNYIYVIVDRETREAAIIDPAWDIKGVLSLLCDIGAKLTSILLTHSHFDHVNLVSRLLKEFKPRVYMSAEEISFYCFHCDNLNPLRHLDTISLGHTLINFISTPGHTVGGACYLLSESIFTGDTIFIEGCGICTPKGGSPEKMFESIQYIKKWVNYEVRVYPGHSYGKEPGYPLSYLIENNIYFLIDKKDIFISFRMRKNQKNLFNFK